MRGGDVAKCPTFHMGNGSICQCIDCSGRQIIEMKKSWLLGTRLATGDRRCKRGRTRKM